MSTEFTFRPIDKWPRKMTSPRKRANFSRNYAGIFRHLERELSHLGARTGVIQLALDESEIRLDGKPRAGASPSHPGVIVCFESKKSGAIKMPCDAFLGWLDNLYAISLALESLRRVDRFGVTSLGEQYRGWNQLPPPGRIVTPPKMSIEEAASFIARASPTQVAGAAQNIVGSPDTFATCYRAAAKRLHPDSNGGTHADAWHMLQTAAEVLRKHHGL